MEAIKYFICVIGLALLTQVLGQTVKYEKAELDGLVFSISDTQLPWAQAVKECESRNEKLVSMESPVKDDILVRLFVEKENTSVTLKGNSWISATESREGVWYWQSLDKPLYHSRWFMDGQPDDKENLNCVYLAASAMLYWRDANCSASMYYICEGSPDTTTTTTTPQSTTASGPRIRISGMSFVVIMAVIAKVSVILFN